MSYYYALLILFFLIFLEKKRNSLGGAACVLHLLKGQKKQCEILFYKKRKAKIKWAGCNNIAYRVIEPTLITAGESPSL